jgi:hypothetical protein
MSPYLLRLAYAFQLLLALIAVLFGWSQIGGQVHLDLMPWYDKLLCGGALSVVIVLATREAVNHERWLNRKTAAYIILAIVILSGMGILTYYYHLQEEDEQESGSGDVAARVFLSGMRPSL